MNEVILGNCLDVMPRLIAEGVKVQTCVTSPTPHSAAGALWERMKDEGDSFATIGSGFTDTAVPGMSQHKRGTPENRHK